ncbi:hypothetical protein GCM10027081_00720 [Cupriavidus yeoncheonensis]
MELKTTRLREKIAQLRQQMHSLDQINEELKTLPDGRISMTDPDARSMATSGKGSGMVGYNVQMAVKDYAPGATGYPGSRCVPDALGLLPMIEHRPDGQRLARQSLGLHPKRSRNHRVKALCIEKPSISAT